MKKLVTVCLGVAMALSITGCGDKVKLTEEQNDLIAEYVAGVMLKHSYENEWNYQKLSIAQNTYTSKGSMNNNTTSATNSTTATNQQTSTSSTSTQSTKTTSKTKAVGTAITGDVIADVKNALNLRNADIKYSKYVVGDRYPTDEFAICVPASEGCKVIAVEFTINNNTAENIEANTAASGVNFSININGTTVKQLTSILKNDISALSKVNIPSGSGYTAVALFQVADKVADNISSMSIEAYQNNTLLGTIPMN